MMLSRRAPLRRRWSPTCAAARRMSGFRELRKGSRRWEPTRRRRRRTEVAPLAGDRSRSPKAPAGALYLVHVSSTLRTWARSIKRDTHALYLAARDPRVPWYAKALALLVAGYALSPIDLIPDFIPVLGYLDDVIFVPFGILAVVKLVPPAVMAEHRETAALAADRPVSRAAMVVIVLVWATAIALTAWLSYRVFWG